MRFLNYVILSTMMAIGFSGIALARWTPPQAECVRKCEAGDLTLRYGYRKGVSSCAKGFRKVPAGNGKLCILKKGWCKMTPATCRNVRGN